MNVAVIGAGAAGLAAAYDLSRAGHRVTIYEAAAEVGGLASGFKAPHWDWTLEKFYHHWFASDRHILRLIDELGWSDRVVFKRPVTAVYYAGRFYAFDSPLAVLRFPGLSLVDRVRFGAVALYLRLTPRWQPLERVTAHAWLTRWLGPRAYRALWEPLLVGKFGEAYARQVNMAWFWARIHARTPRLGTYQGGFQAFLDQLAERVQKQGVALRLKTAVERIQPAADGGLQLRIAGGEEHVDACLVTTSPMLLARLAPDLPPDYRERLTALKSLGAVALVLALDRPLGSGVYWHNLPKDAGFPFLALVEHTQYMSPNHYGGDHLVYCGDYLPADHAYFTKSKEELLAIFLPALRRFNPAFDPAWVKDSWMFRTPYAQPVPFVNHSRHLPDLETPMPGLWLASMSQVYPWDRGTNFAVELGRRAAGRILSHAHPDH